MLSKILFIGMLAGSAVDVGTTELALSRPGFYETNPLIGNRAVRITINVAVPIALWKLTKDKPVKQQILYCAPYIGLKAYAGIHNWKEIQGEKG